MSQGIATKASALYATLTEWCSHGVRQHANPFTSQRIQVWRPELVTQSGPCVLLATPAALHGGVSLRVFQEWAPGAGNLLLLQQASTTGTIGNILKGGGKKEAAKKVKLKDGSTVTVRCKVQHRPLILTAYESPCVPPDRADLRTNCV